MAQRYLDLLQADYGRSIDREITAWLEAEPPHLRGFYDMMRYQLAGEGAPTSGVGQPRLCSLLCLVACDTVGGNGHDAVCAAVAIEVLASWFQIHRDIELHDPEDRGRASLWRQWGEAQAINAGDGMFPLSCRIMHEAANDPELSLLLVRELTETALVHAEGQHMDLALRSQEHASSDQYLRMVELKTGMLAGYSAWVGAKIGGGDEDVQREIRRFGRALGAAWHVQADFANRGLLDVTATGESSCRMPPVPRPELVVRQYLDKALAALKHAPIPPSGSERLIVLAEETAPL